MRGTEEVRDDTNSWLQKKGVWKENEGLIMATEDQSLQTRWENTRKIEQLILRNAECVENWLKMLVIYY